MTYVKYVNMISRCSMMHRNSVLKGIDLNGPQCSYIINICKYPGISQDRLARMIYVNKSNVTRQLCLLERNGYVVRQISQQDRRVIEVYPTDKAKSALPFVMEVLKGLNDYLGAGFSDEEKERFLDYLQRASKRAMDYVDNALVSEK